MKVLDLTVFSKIIIILVFSETTNKRICLLFFYLLKEAAKISYFFNGSVFKALTPPPLELNGRKNEFKKTLFFPYTPTFPNGTVMKKMTFFAASHIKRYHCPIMYIFSL